MTEEEMEDLPWDHPDDLLREPLMAWLYSISFNHFQIYLYMYSTYVVT